METKQRGEKSVDASQHAQKQEKMVLDAAMCLGRSEMRLAPCDDRWMFAVEALPQEKRSRGKRIGGVVVGKERPLGLFHV